MEDALGFRVVFASVNRLAFRNWVVSPTPEHTVCTIVGIGPAVLPGSRPILSVPMLSHRFRVALALGAWVGTYLVLISVGLFFVIYKTVVVPVFLGYALFIPDNQRGRYLRAWLPFLAGTVLFDLLRGQIFHAVQSGLRPVYVGYVIALEQNFFGTLAAPLLLQRAASPFLDGLAFVFHASHFMYFLLIGVVLWHRKPEDGVWLQRALLVVMAIGLIVYFVVPTAPPWLAANYGLIPPVRHVVGDYYQKFVGTQLVNAFDTNPVAAMPSLHTAFPVVCAIVSGRTFGTFGKTITWGWAVAVVLSVMYLGEHYLIDVVAGILTAVLAARVTKSRIPTSGF